jgi:hypothetical protein
LESLFHFEPPGQFDLFTHNPIHHGLVEAGIDPYLTKGNQSIAQLPRSLVLGATSKAASKMLVHGPHRGLVQ